MTSYSGINSGQNFSGQNIVNQNVYNQYPSSPGLYLGIDILLNTSAPDAAVDSKARAYSPRCFPGTREQYIEDITNWATASADDYSPLIYHMKGPAGVGKTAIAQTCAERVKEQDKLGAAFFFSINGCKDEMRFFTSVAYQLSTVLPEYKRTLNDRILNDKTIVNKAIASQFKELIVTPIQKLKSLGREVGMRTIFIDGLDECQSPGAQSQIIELIAASVREGTVPFRWAFFSRAEVHIETAFNLDFIIPLCCTVELPISREVDKEIQLYLEGGLKNIARQQSLAFLSPWPSPEAIQKLVDASAGLYAHPAAVLHFIESSPAGDPKEAMAAILEVISQPNSSTSPPSPFAELDAFYMLIMRRIPGQLLLSIQILLTSIVDPKRRLNPTSLYPISSFFSCLQLSETVLSGVRKHLHAVIRFQDAPPTLKLGSDIDINRPYYEQRVPSDQEENAIISSMGALAFRHKSFYDFLADPARSATFCVCAPAMWLNLFIQDLQTHLNLSQSYVVQDTELIFGSGVPHYAAVLSSPFKNEYINSYMQDFAFAQSINLYYFLKPIQHQLMKKLSDLDYRKHLLVSLRVFPGFERYEDIGTMNVDLQTNTKSQFRRVHPDRFNYIEFISRIKLLKKLGIIRPHYPNFTFRLTCFFRSKGSGSNHSGLYTLGRGDRAVFWFWEFNPGTNEYYDFWTLDLKGAMEIFKANKYKMWSHDWTPPPS